MSHANAASPTSPRAGITLAASPPAQLMFIWTIPGDADGTSCRRLGDNKTTYTGLGRWSPQARLAYNPKSLHRRMNATHEFPNAAYMREADGSTADRLRQPGNR